MTLPITRSPAGVRGELNDTTFAFPPDKGQCPWALSLLPYMRSTTPNEMGLKSSALLPIKKVVRDPVQRYGPTQLHDQKHHSSLISLTIDRILPA